MYVCLAPGVQGEKRPSLPTTYKLPVLTFAAREVGVALVGWNGLDIYTERAVVDFWGLGDDLDYFGIIWNNLQGGEAWL